MRFKVTSLDASGAVAVHEIDALDEADARRQAGARGLRILNIEAARLGRAGRAKLALVPFSNELVALLEAGLTLVEAIDALTEKERDESIRNVLDGLRRRLFEGQSFSVALGEFPSTFPALFVATVRASERSGAISESLRRYVTYQEQINVLKKRLINASIYPAVLLSAGLLVVLFLVAYVVPRFSSVYEEIGGELPLASRLLMQWGKLLEAHGMAVLLGFLAFVAAFVYMVSQASFRAAVGRSILKIPAIGRQMQT
jgi:general secretion pathway protein F